jgi:hypothetical protein
MNGKPVRVRLRVVGDTFPEVDAYPTPAPGLVVHKAIDANGWMITQATTGCGVARFGNPEAALTAATELGTLADWTGPVDMAAVSEAGSAVICQRWGALPNPTYTWGEARRAGAIL